MRSLAATLLLGATLLWLAARLPLWMSFDANPPEGTSREAPTPEQQAVADNETLLHKFDLTAFRGDEGQYYDQPIPDTYKSVQGTTFALFGHDSERFRDAVVELIEELSLLTGLDMTVRPVNESGPQDFFVVVIPPDLIETMLGRDDIIARFGDLRPYDGSCFALPYIEGFEIIKGIAVVPNDLPISWIRHCLMVEITQAFGLFADSDVLETSIFSDHGPPRTQLPLDDKIILRTLYDPRITPGMPREEALEVAREVIRELVDAVRRDGVEALYQRPRDPPQP
jgi:hypothetical protein